MAALLLLPEFIGLFLLRINASLLVIITRLDLSSLNVFLPVSKVFRYSSDFLGSVLVVFNNLTRDILFFSPCFLATLFKFSIALLGSKFFLLFGVGRAKGFVVVLKVWNNGLLLFFLKGSLLLLLLLLNFILGIEFNLPVLFFLPIPLFLEGAGKAKGFFFLSLKAILIFPIFTPMGPPLLEWLFNIILLAIGIVGAFFIARTIVLVELSFLLVGGAGKAKGFLFGGGGAGKAKGFLFGGGGAGKAKSLTCSIFFLLFLATWIAAEFPFLTAS